MISVGDALGRILSAAKPLGSQSVSLAEALGRVLSEPVVARCTQPPDDLSAMDGYAVRAADVAAAPLELRLIGEAPAGAPFAGIVKAGQALRIFTGGAVPDGADTIVIQEHTIAGAEGWVRIEQAAAEGRHIRRKGFDFKAGETVLEAGGRLGSRQIALAAAANVPELTVGRRPVVAILTTGSELEAPGSKLAPGHIANSNTPLLAAMVVRRGGVAKDLGTIGDDSQELKAALEGLEGADMLVTIGGASVGDHDLVQETLSEIGLTVDFWKIAMRPGKPLIFGDFGGIPMIGLPGNPVSAAVCTIVYLLPALDRMQGASRLGVEEVTARLQGDLPENGPRQAYLRAGYATSSDGVPEATPMPVQDSSALKSLSEAGALIVRPPGAPALVAGDLVPVLPLEGL